MSYDLYFSANSEQSNIDNEKVLDWFSSRPNYQVSNFQVIYENPETDVHFIWNFLKHSDADPEDPFIDCFISLSINFARPLYFAKEAAMELVAFVKAFNVKTFDPQKGAFWNAPISERTLVEKYEKNAASGARAILAINGSSDKIYTLNSARLDEIWDWNFKRDELTASLEEDLFVPKISTFLYKGEVVTAIVWGDGVPMLAPKVDIILALRRETGPKTGFFRKRIELIEIITYDKFLHDFQAWFKPSSLASNAVSSAPSSNERIKAKLRKRPAGTHTFLNRKSSTQVIQQIATSAIIDAELFED